MKRSLCMVSGETAVSDQIFQEVPSASQEADAKADATLHASEFELFPENYFAPLDLAAVFGRIAPLEVDLGCGDGGFFAQLAAKFPERNYLGIEKLGGRVRRGCKKAARLAVRNLRFLRIESAYAVEYLLPPGSVEAVHLLFPDPWPKKKHKRRRIVQPAFLESIHRVLGPGGRFRIATDQETYFKTISDLISPAAFAEECPPPGESFPVTTFERHFIREGAPIYRLDLRKAS
ncbi:MAG: tRNA (guanosine(46)-N7)-methyltransferase TrmB [Chthoniobacterales bacterium]